MIRTLNPRTVVCLLAAWFSLLGAPASGVAQEDYDLLIRGGKIVDGTGNPWFYGDVGIRGDRIAAVGSLDEAQARQVIDATGLVVAPGFIDIHSHSDFVLLEDGRAFSKIHQGVTTEILGEGDSAGPYQGKLAPRRLVLDGEPVQWNTLGEYFDLVDERGISVNIGSYVGINNIWQSVMGTSFDRPTAEQIKQMQGLVDEAMQQGALGLSTQVMMPPGSLATTEELIQLCAPVKAHHGIYSTHIRNEGLGVFEAVREAIRIGEEAGVPVDIIHLKIADQQYWGRMREVLDLIQAARDRGVNVQSNVYPYTRGNNNLVSIIPPWAHEGGTEKLIERLKDPEQRKRLKHDIEHGVEGWYNHYTAVGKDWSRMLVAENNTYKGLTMDRVLELRANGRSEVDPLDELFDILIETGGSVSTVYAHHTEEDMTLALSQPWCSVGSDGSAYAIEGPLRQGNPHPRNFGTFPRLLGLYVREQELLSLEEAVKKITWLNATKVGLRDRGQLSAGCFADVTIFDPATVIDGSTYVEPFSYGQGIEYVIVNGQTVLRAGEHTGEKPGRALRRPGSNADANQNPAAE